MIRTHHLSQSLGTSRKIWIVLLSSLGMASLGVRSASAATVTFQSNPSDPSTLSTLLQFNCDLKTTSTCSQSFNNYDDPNSWLTVIGAGGDVQKWAVKGTLTLANANLGTSTTGDQLGAKVFTFTAAKLAYMSGGATTSTLTGLKFFSDNIDFTTTAFGTTRLLSNPALIHQTSGSFAATPNSNVNGSDLLASSVNLVVSGKDASGNTITNQTLNNILQNNSSGSGTPNGSLFPFSDSSTQLNVIPQLSNGSITTNLLQVRLGKGDTLNLPASECVIVGERKATYQNGKHVETDIVDGAGTILLKRQGQPGQKFTTTLNRAEELCTQVAHSVKPVPEPTEMPVLGGLILGSLGWFLRKR